MSGFHEKCVTDGPEFIGPFPPKAGVQKYSEEGISIENIGFWCISFLFDTNNESRLVDMITEIQKSAWLTPLQTKVYFFIVLLKDEKWKMIVK